jgi:hypothetical protein
MQAENEIPADRWVAIQDGYDAYVRLDAGLSSGEVRVRLGLRYVLVEQVGVKIAGAGDQTTFRKLGEAFGVFDLDPAVPCRMTGGTRLVVLALAVTGEIIAVPFDDAEPEAKHASDNDVPSLPVTDQSERGTRDDEARDIFLHACAHVRGPE